jgi:hypothetical protein
VEAAEGPELVVGADRETWESMRADGTDQRAVAALTRAAQDLLGNPRAQVRQVRKKLR